ncbi:MAG: two-component sensor histidine kinase [Gammaproteobacteria bacterium HGW-Gammaproteobacteria-3]|nr:MAG: two-component sensor histidine kinase [Gammaproteobacteria bacterium HGW-Gammaproteobacteria-3]
MRYSLKQVLLFALLSATVLIWGVTAYISYKVTRDEVVKLFDAELEQSAHALYAFVGHLLYEGSLYELWDLDSPDNTLPTNQLVSKYRKKIAFQLIYKDEGLILRSQTAPEHPMSNSLNGFTRTEVDGHLWHVFSLSHDKDEYIIHVGQRDDIRQLLKDDIASHLMRPLLTSLPFLGLVIWLVVGRSLKPVNRLTRQLALREANYLKPLSTRYLPNEIVPVVDELNELFAQLEKAFENERRFTADAAHELKTPLAGLLTQAQVASKTKDESVRRQALTRIEQAVKRMTTMVQQLLTFSRIESDPGYLVKKSVELGREVIDIIAELEPEAHKKQISMGFDHHAEGEVNANEFLIGVLLRNIIDNAIKYTPVGGKIAINLRRQAGLLLSIEDSGPGIAPEHYDDSFKRFYRCVETANKVPGSGLGLSMAQRIAAVHNAELSMAKSRFGGLKISLYFPEPVSIGTLKKTRKPKFFNRNRNNPITHKSQAGI